VDGRGEWVFAASKREEEGEVNLISGSADGFGVFFLFQNPVFLVWFLTAFLLVLSILVRKHYKAF